ncbi:hypothetical protein E2C01_043631 [Portunus trituberculatus]|uniref:Uncharacterized protein n=1 Tax=Portunus trituberculatus TaxID=210409 RepID=A0A5B7FWL8_PORTR|nr:hypothetical protein [Portunus trituberculatus]
MALTHEYGDNVPGFGHMFLTGLFLKVTTIVRRSHWIPFPVDGAKFLVELSIKESYLQTFRILHQSREWQKKHGEMVRNVPLALTE